MVGLSSMMHLAVALVSRIDWCSCMRLKMAFEPSHYVMVGQTVASGDFFNSVKQCLDS